jgi:osmotically-inducible protein OsmY
MYRDFIHSTFQTTRVFDMKTDKQLQSDVIAELNWEPSINASKIGVEVSEGVVTLAGHVNSYSDKWNAEAAAQRVAGVKSLTIEIDVNLIGLAERTDADIAHSAKNILQWTSFLTDDAVKIMVEKGWITLTGEVDWNYQRVAAATALRYLSGVTGLTNKIGVKPKVSLGAVRADIETAIKRQALKDASKIGVAIHGSEVTLSGTVNSWSERNLVRQSAWNTPGVLKVVDNITFVF